MASKIKSSLQRVRSRLSYVCFSCSYKKFICSTEKLDASIFPESVRKMLRIKGAFVFDERSCTGRGWSAASSPRVRVGVRHVKRNGMNMCYDV